jgi:ribose transport system ATP-binding protein
MLLAQRVGRRLSLEGEKILSLRHLTKIYPGVMALDNVSLDFERGEVHALVGENGAGKSTLIKAISGAIQPDEGEIVVAGTSYKAMTPTLSRKAGIAIIYQEFTLVPVMSSAENIFLGEFIRNGWICNQAKMNEITVSLFEKLGVDIDPRTLVQNLSTGYQQIVEIAKAVSKNAKILIMDEPTAPLANAEVAAMFRIIRMLQKEGVTIIYISHRLEEIFQISDRVSVMRDGEYVATRRTSETNKDELIKLMVGRELSEAYPPRPTNKNATILSLRGLTGNGVKKISFDVKKGEILGIAGLMGAGRTELAQLLFGYRAVTGGKVMLNGKAVLLKKPGDAIRNGIALIPEDRKQQGLVMGLSVKENIIMPLLRKVSRYLIVSDSSADRIANRYIDKLRIKVKSLNEITKTLSGGNQQKVVLGKWLSTEPEIIILDEPTRGIDVGAKQEIYNIMVDLVHEGKTIIMISSDMEELIGMSDRMVVLCKGRLTGVLEKHEFDQEYILRKSEGAGSNEEDN